MKKSTPFKSRIKTVGIILLIFVCLYVIGQDPYMIDWLASNYFLFVWAPICLLFIFNFTACAWSITWGSFLGIAAGQGIEMLRVSVFNGAAGEGAPHWGVPAWIVIVALTAILGIILEIRARKPELTPEELEAKEEKKRQEKKEKEAKKLEKKEKKEQEKTEKEMEKEDKEVTAEE